MQQGTEDVQERTDLTEKTKEFMRDFTINMAKIVYARPLGTYAKISAAVEQQNMEIDLREMEWYERKMKEYGGDPMDLVWNIT